MTITSRGADVAALSLSLEADGHQPTLTDAEELHDVEGLDVEPGSYLMCYRCGELWRI